MADKFAFTMQVFFLGFSVVMLVLFLLYGLISLFNRLRSPLLGKAGPEEPPLPDDWELLPPELIAAITAAVHHYRQMRPALVDPCAYRLSCHNPSGLPPAGELF